VLIIVRHGQTAHNATRRLAGRVDIELDPVGVRQAAAVAPHVGAPVRVIASPLSRARATAEALAGALPIEIDDRWLELDYGEWDGVPLAEVPPDVWKQWLADPTFRPPGGETLAEMGERVRAACADLADDARAGDVVVVTHVSPIKAAVAWALAAGDELSWKLHVSNASITRIGFGPRGPVLHTFNETQHLPV
jgi:broad specificity phosphatase PhoE